LIPYRVLKKLVKKLVQHRLLTALVAVIAVDLVSAILFYAFEYQVQDGLTFFDCVYWATITMSTIGYGDITPKTIEGKSLATFTSVAGIASFTLLVSLLAEKFLMATIRRREGLITVRRSNVVVICDIDIRAKEIVDELKQGGGFSDITVLLPHHHTPRVEFGWSDVEVVRGDLVSDDALARARIAQANIVIISLSDDSRTIHLVLKIRRKNRKCRIYAKANHFEAVDLISQAGADDVVSPMAQEKLLACFAHEPHVVRFIVDAIEAGQGIDLDQRKAPRSVVGMKFIDALSTLKRTENVIIVAIVRDGRIIANPPEDELIKEDDLIITLRHVQE